MNLLGKVRRLHHRDGLTLSEIERRTGLTRKIIRKWLKAPEGSEPKYRRQQHDTKIAAYAEQLTRMLEIDARRSPRERRTALKLHAELKAQGFDGHYSRVTEFIRHWRKDSSAALKKAYVPLRFEPGEAHQFDWSDERLVIGGVWRKLTVAHLKLCHSRAFVVQAFFSTADLVNLLEQEKAASKAGRLAFSLLRMDLVILDELWATCRSARPAVRSCSICSRSSTSIRV